MPVELYSVLMQSEEETESKGNKKENGHQKTRHK